MKVYDLGNTQWKQLTPTSSQQTAIDTVSTNITNVNLVGTAISTNALTGATSFAEKYRVASSAPTTSLDLGDLYFDTTQNELKVYKSSGWSSAGSTINGTSARFTYNITGTPTTVSGADANGNTLAYDAGFADVFVNGVRMSSSDITITSGNSVVFASALANGDVVDIVGFGTFNVASIAASSITSGILPTARGGTGVGTLGSAGQALVVNAAANALEFANASSAEVYGFNSSFTASTIYYNVAVQSVGGSNKYFIMGTQQKTLELEEGNTYIFDHPSAHPLRFSTDSNNSTPYTTGVTVVSSTRVQIVVATNAPTLYYYCNVHAGMGGQANTPAPFNNTLQVTTTNQGQDDISASTYAGFDDVIFAASGFTFSLNNGDLIATV